MVNVRTLALSFAFGFGAYYTWQTERLNMYFRAILVLIALWLFVGSFPLGAGTIPCWLGGTECNGNGPSPTGKRCSAGKICVPPTYPPLVEAGYTSKGQQEGGGTNCIDSCCAKTVKLPQHEESCIYHSLTKSCTTKALPDAQLRWPSYACHYKRTIDHECPNAVCKTYQYLVKGVPNADSPCGTGPGESEGRVESIDYGTSSSCPSNETAAPNLSSLCCKNNTGCFTDETQCQLPPEVPAKVQISDTITLYSVELGQYLAYNGSNQPLTLLSTPSNPLCQWKVINTQHENLPAGTTVDYNTTAFSLQNPSVEMDVKARKNADTPTGYDAVAGPANGNQNIVVFIGGCGNLVSDEPGTPVRSMESVSIQFTSAGGWTVLGFQYDKESKQYSPYLFEASWLDPVNHCVIIQKSPNITYGTTWQVRGPNGKPIYQFNY